MSVWSSTSRASHRVCVCVQWLLMFVGKPTLYVASLTITACVCLFNGVLRAWEQIWPELLCDGDFIKRCLFHRMAATHKTLKRKAHNLPIIHIMCQNIETWFMSDNPDPWHLTALWYQNVVINIIYYKHSIKLPWASRQMLLNGGFGCLSFDSFIPGNIIKISNETFNLILRFREGWGSISHFVYSRKWLISNKVWLIELNHNGELRGNSASYWSGNSSI